MDEFVIGRSPRYEYEPDALFGERRPLDKQTWLSWSGRRWLNGREYHGPVLPLGGTEPVKRQARVCPCDVCQQTNPWRVDALEYRALAEEADRLLLTWYVPDWADGGSARLVWGINDVALRQETIAHLHARGLVTKDGQKATPTGEALIRASYKADCPHAVWLPLWETGNTSELRFRGVVRCEACFLTRSATASESERFAAWGPALGSAPPPRDRA